MPDAFENNKANAQTKINMKSKSRDFKIIFKYTYTFEAPR